MVTSGPTAPERHLGFVLSIAFSADGKRLYYSNGAEGTVHVCDLATGELLQRWPCHQAPITQLRRSRDGKQLFTASFDGTVGIWDAADGSLIGRLSGHRGGVHSLDLSDEHIAAGGFDGTVRVWSIHSDAPATTIEAHTDAVTALAFLTPDRLVSASRDGTARVWDMGSGDCLRVLEGHRHWVTKLAALADGRLLSAGEDGICNLWDCESGKVVWGGAIDGPIWGLALAPSGEFAITGTSVTRWEISSGGSRVLDGVRAGRAIAISPDNALAACGADSGDIQIYDLALDEVVRTIPSASQGGLDAAVDVTGTNVATGHQNGSLVLYAPDGVRRTLHDAHEFMAYALCRVGERGFASGAFDGTVCVWDFQSGELLDKFSHPGRFVFSAAATADGRFLLSAGSDAWCLWDLVGKQEVKRVNPTGSGDHSHADLASDGSVIVAAGEDEFLRVWQPDGTLSSTIAHDCGQIADVCLLPDTRAVLLADARGRVSLLDLDTHACERLHEEHEDWIRHVDVTPDGRYAVSVSQNFICRIYDLETRRLCVLDVLDTPIPAAAITAEGRIVAVSARGEVLRVM